MNYLPFLLISMGLSLAACESGTDTEGTPDSTNKADNEALAACGTAACPGGFAQRIELHEPFTINNMACIVEAMRDRTPGLYRVTLDHTWTNGGDISDFTIFITAAGEVEVGVRRRSFQQDEPETETWEPTERCSLASESFFDACLTAVKAGDQVDSTAEAWACIYPGSEQDESQELPWFEGCEAQAPTCD